MKFKKETSNKSVDIYLIVIAISYLLVGILFGWFLYDNVLHYDKSIFWTALAAIGSLSLAVVATLQNRKLGNQSYENSKREALENDKLMKLNEQANNINQRMMKLQEAQYIPMFSITGSNFFARLMETTNWSQIDDQSHQIIDTSIDTHIANSFYCITFNLTNKSQITITRINIHDICWENQNIQNTNIESRSVTINLDSNETLLLRIGIPTSINYHNTMGNQNEALEERRPVSFQLDCENLFGYKTKSILECSNIRYNV